MAGKKSRKIKVLFVAATPDDQDRIHTSKEIREIHESIKRSRFSSKFQIKEVHSARFKDLRRALLEFRPHIVHISGHGTFRGIILVGEDDKSDTVPGGVLAELLAEFPGIECVVLNNCYSVSQAKILVKKSNIQCVVGSEEVIWDEAAIAFAEGFYDALGNGEDYFRAFRLGKVSAQQKQPDVVLRFLGHKGNQTVEALEVGLLKTVSTAQNLIENCSRLRQLYAELEQEEVVRRLQEKADELEDMINSPLRVHVALVGASGVGKTTLLNALIEKKVAVGGGGEAQSAAVISLEHRPISHFEVVVHYLSTEALIQLLMEANSQLSHRDLSRLPDQQGLSKELRILLETLDLSPQRVASLEFIHLEKEGLLHIFPSSIRSRIDKEERKTILDEDSLLSFISEYTNSSGRFWPITDLVEVKGPFPSIPSNVILLDLPGLGDLSKIRIARSRENLAKANQLILVVGERGINREVRDFLASLDIVSTILTHDKIPQVLIVGSRLDQWAVSLNEIDKNRLGITSDMSDDEVLKRIFKIWTNQVRDNWQDVLLKWGRNTLHGKALEELPYRVDRILNNTKIIPAVPLLYLRAIGIEPKVRWGLQIQDKELTGIPSVQHSLREALSAQERLTAIEIHNKAAVLREESIRLASGLLEQLQRDMSSAQNEIRFWKKLAQGLKYEVSWTLDSVTTSELQKNVQNDFMMGWKDLSPDSLRKIFEEEGYIALYYQTLMAAFRRKGKYKSRGKSRAEVNIPSKLRYYVSSQAFLTIKNFSKTTLENFSYQADKEAENFCRALELTAHDICTSLLDMDKSEIKSFPPIVILQQILEEHREEVKKASKRVLKFDETIWDEIIDEAIGHSMHSVFEEALKEKGRGARARSLERIYHSAPDRLSVMAAEASFFIEKQTKEWLNSKRQELLNEIFRIEKGTMRRIKQYKKLVVSSQQRKKNLKPYISQTRRVLTSLKKDIHFNY